MRSSVEEIVAFLQQQGGIYAFQAEDDSLAVLQDFQATYDTLLDLEYQGVIRITARERENQTGQGLIHQVAVRLEKVA